MPPTVVDQELEDEIERSAPRAALGSQMYIRPERDVQEQIKAIAKRKRVPEQTVIRALLRRGLRRQPPTAQ